MSAIYDSFKTLSADDFETYAQELVDKSVSAVRRKQALTYLQQVVSGDKVLLDTEKDELNANRLSQRKRQKAIDALLASHDFDFSRDSALFQQASTTNTELASLLQLDNQELFIKNRVITGDVIISGDNVTLDGQSNGKSAVEEKLQNTATVTGTLTISGDNCTVKGIDFTSTGEKAITFSGDCKNLTLVSCTFTAGVATGSESKWFYGEGFGGDSLTIRNCRVEGFQSWYLMDATTTSALATDNLKRFKLKDCFFKNNLGSIAIRGLIAKPIKSAVVTGNKWETDTLSSSFWDFLEISGAVSYVEIQNNQMIAPVGTNLLAGKVGGYQLWTKSGKPFVIHYKNNSVQNLRVACKVVAHTGFYAPDTSADDYLIDFTEGDYSNTFRVFSAAYKKLDGTTPSIEKYINGDYAPENVTL